MKDRVPTSTGAALLAILAALGMTQTDLARSCRLTVKHVNGLIHGRAGLTPHVAAAIGEAVALRLLETDFRSRFGSV